jgi:SAM-dependent methyltransferase
MVLPLFAAMMVTAQLLLDRPESALFVYGAPLGGDPAVQAGDRYLSSTFVAFAAVALFGYGPVFVLQGLVFALYFQEGREEGVLSGVYGTDLLASGGGAVAGGLLGFALNPIQMAVLSALSFLLALGIAAKPLRIPPARVWVAMAATLGLVSLELLGGVGSRIETPRWLQTPAVVQWSRYRRITALETPAGLSVFADGILFQMYDLRDPGHQRDPRRFTAEIIRCSPRPVRDVLVVGAGTGSDVRILRDRLGDDLRITAVEIDEGFPRVARAFPWLWDRFRTAEIVAQEGRYYLENCGKDFDLVLYAYVDPQAAVGTVGIPDANFLYTDAGLRAALSRVREGGALVITRVYLVREEEEFLRRMCATLRSAGARPGNTRIYRHAGSVAWGYYGELTTLHVLVGKSAPPPEPEKKKGLVPLAWSDGGRPTTDLFPFSLGTGIWFDTLMGFVSRHAVAIGALLLAAAGLALAGATSLSRGTFLVLGFGSFLLESLVLFNSFLLLGDPGLSAALAVGVFLFWNGVGSILSEKAARRPWVLAAVPLAVLLYAATAPLLNAWTLSSSSALRGLLFALHLAPAGVAAGLMFPVALRAFPDRPVPTLFFMDVVGCAMAPPLFWLSIGVVGVWLVVVGAVAGYAGVVLLLALRR